MRDQATLSGWQRLLDISLSQSENESVGPLDPFMGLKYTETVADNITFSLATRRMGRTWEVRQCFEIGGHPGFFVNRICSVRQDN